MYLKAFSILTTVLALTAGTVSAQEKTPYQTEREALIEENFFTLVEMCSLLDQMNLAGDLAYGDNLIEGHNGLRTALLENLFFDYCNVSDSLKTVENFRITTFVRRNTFTFSSRPEWDALGRIYTERRTRIERLGNPPALPLHLPRSPLAPGTPLPRRNKLAPPRREIIPR